MLCDGLSPLITGFGLSQTQWRRSADGIKRAQSTLGLRNDAERFPAQQGHIEYPGAEINASVRTEADDVFALGYVLFELGGGVISPEVR